MFDDAMKQLGEALSSYLIAFLIYFGIPFVFAVIILRILGVSPKLASLIGAILGIFVYWQFGNPRLI